MVPLFMQLDSLVITIDGEKHLPIHVNPWFDDNTLETAMVEPLME
jgi:hypothetical protein